MLAAMYADLRFRSRQFFIALMGARIARGPALGRRRLTDGHRGEGLHGAPG